MLQLRREFDLGEKSFGAERRGDFRPHDFDRHFAAVADVVGEVDRGHAAFAELALDVVSAGQARSQRLVGLGHAIRVFMAAMTARAADSAAFSGTRSHRRLAPSLQVVNYQRHRSWSRTCFVSEPIRPPRESAMQTSVRRQRTNA